MDEASFTRLYEVLHPRVLAYALRRVPPDQARDVAAETFLIAWRKRADLPAAVLPWLLVTARHTIAERWRRSQRDDVLAAEIARTASSTSEPGADVAVVERLTVLSALARLTDRDRDVLMLTAWDGLGTQEAARVAGCSTTAFGVRLHRARRRFTAALHELDRYEHISRPAGAYLAPTDRNATHHDLRTDPGLL